MVKNQQEIKEFFFSYYVNKSHNIFFNVHNGLFKFAFSFPFSIFLVMKPFLQTQTNKYSGVPGVSRGTNPVHIETAKIIQNGQVLTNLLTKYNVLQ